MNSPERDSVDIRLPLGLVRTGLKLSALMPGKVSAPLSERGIDLSHLGKLDDEALIAELAALQIHVAAGTARRSASSASSARHDTLTPHPPRGLLPQARADRRPVLARRPHLAWMAPYERRLNVHVRDLRRARSGA